MNIKGTCIRKHEPICSFNVIVDNLVGCEVVHVPPCGQRRFAWCCVPRSTALSSQDCDPNILLLFTLSSLEGMSRCLGSCCGVLFLEEDDPFSVERPPFDPYYLDYLLVLRSTGEEGFSNRIQSDLQALFLEFNDIAAECEMIVARGGESQDIIDVFEPLYGNWINVSDATYNLVARTQNIEPPDPLTKQLVDLGCHSIDNVNRARNSGIFRDWREQRDIEVFDAWEIVPCGHMTAVLRIDGIYYGHVVTVFNATPYTPGVEDVFRTLVGYIKAILDKKSKRSSDGFTACQHFMELLISNDRDLTDSYIESQTQILDVPKEGYFRLAAINYANGDCSNQPLHLMNVIKSTFSHTLPFLHERSILVLYCEAAFDAKCEKNALDDLERFCQQYGCTAMVSGYSLSINQVALLFEQINIVKRYQSCAESASFSFGERSRVFRFGEVFGFYCCDYGKKDDSFFEYCVNHTVLDLISENEHDRDVCDIKLLYCYLVSERRAAPVAELLHMHRNNVIYRINSIERRYNLDLNRFEVRDCLLACFRLKIMHSAKFRKLLA